MCMHHPVVTDQHIFVSKSCMISVMVVCMHAYMHLAFKELMRVGGGSGYWDMFTSQPF